MNFAKNSLFINMNKGYIHIYTGSGKGKTTAAVGLCYRCSKSGFKVGFTSFMKDFTSSECIDCTCFTIFRHTSFQGFWCDMSDEEKKTAALDANKALSDIFRIAKDEKYDLIALDEVLMAASLGCIDTALLCNLLKNKPDSLEVVMTGNICPEELYDYADYISEIKCIRHPYQKGVQARKGIEF